MLPTLLLHFSALLLQTVAEKEAWRIAKETGLDLVAVLPNFVLGPVISSRADGTSVGFLKVPTLFKPLGTTAPVLLRF